MQTDESKDDSVDPSAPTPEELDELRGLYRCLSGLIAGFPPEQQATFAALRALELGEGPALPVALGCDEAEVRKRTSRLRQALVPLAVDAGLFEKRKKDGAWRLIE